MNKKLAETIALSATLLVGVVYLYHAVTMGNTKINTSLPPGYFPTLVGGLWVLLNVPALIMAARKIKGCEERLVINNVGYFGLTVLAIVVYLCLWQLLNVFYVATFLLLFFLMMLYAEPEARRQTKQLIINAVLSAFVTGLIYLMFGLMLHVRF